MVQEPATAEACLEEARRLSRVSAATERARIEALLDRVEADPGLRSSSLLARANLLFGLGEYDSAVEIGERLKVDPDGPTAGAGLNLIGAIHLERGDWAAALDAFEGALALYDPDDPIRVGNTENNLGLVCWRLGELQAAADHYRRAVACFEVLDRPIHTGNVKNNLGLVVQEAGDIEGARALYSESLDLLIGSPNFHANALGNLAAIDEAEGDLAGAEAKLLQALELRESQENKRGIAGALLALARIAVAGRRAEEARARLEPGRALAESLGLKKHVRDALELEGDLLALEGRWEEAYAARLRFEALRAELEGEDVKLRIETAQNRAVLREARREAERRAAEAEELRIARDEAQSALRARSAFLATTSHELRGPLTVVVGACDLLADVGLEPGHQRLIEMARRSARVLQSVVGDVLDLSRLDSGAIELNIAPLSLDELLEDAVEMARVVRPRPEVDVAWSRTEDVPDDVMGDADRVRQILVNLLTNGVKYTKRGSVRLEVDVVADGLRFTVRDTGVGIPEAFQPVLFDAFTRHETSFVRSQGGTGLGLSIARRLAECMGGTVALQQSGSEGSVFEAIVDLPAAHPVAAAIDEAPALDAALSVLVVDDDPVVRMVVSQMARRLGHRVRVADGAASAREALQASLPDLVLLDLRMPEVEGLDFVREVVTRWPQARTVLLSGDASRESNEDALALGVSVCLAKPVSLEQLAQVLGRAVGASD